MNYVINYYEKDAGKGKESHGQAINGTRPRHRHKYTKYKMNLGMMMVMCNKQHLRISKWGVLT